jgi:NACalpha-BTF3-like transcription factor
LCIVINSNDENNNNSKRSMIVAMTRSTKKRSGDRRTNPYRHQETNRGTNVRPIEDRPQETAGHIVVPHRARGTGIADARIDSEVERHLADCAADVSLKAWVRRTRGATLPPWASGIETIDLARLARPDPDEALYAKTRLILLWAQWGDVDAARSLCHMAHDVCSTDARQWRLAPLLLRKDIALWHPIVAHNHGISVRLFVPTLAEIAAATGADDSPSCVVCMSEAPTMVLEPCGHLCLCAGDWQQLVAGPRGSLKCPLCRSAIEAAWRVRSFTASEREFAIGQVGEDSSRSARVDPRDDAAGPYGLDLGLGNLENALRIARLLEILEQIITREPDAIPTRDGGGFDFGQGVGTRRPQGHEPTGTVHTTNDRGGGGGDDDSDDSDDDTDSTHEAADFVSSSDDSDDDDDDAPREQTLLGIESTGLPFTEADVELVASQAGLSLDIAFDALLATEGNIVDAIRALCL